MQQYARVPTSFRPSLEALFATLELDPKQYPLKVGKLGGYRAAKLRFNRAVEWRLVFKIHEDVRVVRIIALGPHDEAYKSAERRTT